jgi:hypothetical protein
MTKKKVTETSPEAGLTSFMDATEVDGFPVREWTTQQFCELYPFIKQIIEKLTASGMTLENFDASQLQKYLPAIADAAIPVVPIIIKVSCPDKTQEEFDKLPWPKALALTMGIIKRNIEHLADFFGQSPE